VAVGYLVAAIIPYDIALSCQSCTPVAVERPDWGALKSNFR
jgi:hypothetical protein